MRLLALDLGERRIGLAASDAAGALAFPAGHLVRAKLEKDIDRVLKAAQEREIEGFVVGVPYNLNGAAGPGALRARGFIRALQRRTALPVYPVDERFTTVEAEGLLRDAGRQPSREKASVDEAAALLILQRFLERQRAASPPP